MSYLDHPRLHFAGRYKTDPSTVNNLARHFSPDAGQPDPHPEWNWNPDGAHMWLFEGCTVRRVVYGDGSVCEAAAQDPILGAKVEGTNNPYPAKLADLDVEQQYVPSIWGLTLRVNTQAGPDFVEGDFRSIAPFDMWYRASTGPRSGDPDSAFFQSLLEGVAWSKELASRFLRELRDASPEALSIKFVVDGYDKDPKSPNFNVGRVVGSVGPALAGEPAHFEAARLLRPQPGKSQFDGTPFFFAPFRLDAAKGRLWLDLGNSNTLKAIGGGPEDHGDLHLAVLPATGDPALLGPVAYRQAGLYESTAGIQEFALSQDHLNLALHHPLAIVEINQQGALAKTLLREDKGGKNLRADQFTFRLSPGETARVDLVATKFGQPAAGETIQLRLDPEILAKVELVVEGIPVGVPAEALGFPAAVSTAADGRASLVLESGDPGKPRLEGWIDGQVYTLVYSWEGEENPDPQCFLSVRVFDRHPLPDQPTWKEQVGPILQQYARLFPYMKRLLDLGDYPSVQQNREMLKYFLTLPETHPGYMPVTRDLSRDKRALILKWIDNGAPE